MGFSRAFGGTHTPKTYAACLKLWQEASTRKLSKGYLILGSNTFLYRNEKYDTFEVRFHGHIIIEYHPGYKVINACGHSESPTTQGRISALTGAFMSCNASLGYEEKVRVNGYPYFDGIRIDDYGHVLPEDQKPDYKTRPKKEVTRAYATLFMRLEKLLLGRYELGEWAGVSQATYSPGVPKAILELEALIASGETFLPFELVNAIMPYHADTKTPLRELLASTKKACREYYINSYDGYETIEVN